MNSQEAMVILAKDKDIKGETHRVLWFIGGILDFENWVQLSITEIANELDLKQPSVSRAMKVLETKEIIIRGPKVGRSYAFMLNPDFGWKGKVKNLDEYRRRKEDREKSIKQQEREEIPPTFPEEMVEKIRKHSPEVNHLSKEFDIPREKLEKLLSYFQNIQNSSV